MCSVLYLDSILTIGARYSFLGTELGAAAASHRALTPVHSVWEMEDEKMHDPHLILSAATTLYFASTHGRFDKSKV